MTIIQVSGFKGLNKVAMSQAIRKHLSLDLAESKAITDQL